ncbi:MAG: T9SS type A sorting domain-containing protein [candidate division Zixibacteria bacterium]|nr:T9SS type A sorting domain-containing protein [candidate division Zixibacteria bacterium]
MEMSATWMEDQVFDNINDYIYYLSGLSSIFNKPWLSLRNFDGLHPYSACIWPIFLGERFNDINIVKNIWSVCAQFPGDNVLSATDTILKGIYNSSLNDAFREFTVWNYFTGDRANPSLFGFYSEGESFPKVKETDIHDTLSIYPIIDSSFTSQLPENLGANYIVFQPITDSLGGLRIYFEGNTGAGWDASLIDYMSNDQPFEDTTIDLSPDSGMGVVFDWARFSEISMVIARGDTISSGNFKYNYTAEFDTSLFHGFIPPSADKIYQNFPNPFIITDASSTTKFPMLLRNPTNVELFIFTTSGELVWKHRWQNKIGDYTTAVFTAPEFIPFKWDGRNMNGEYVASGIYIYRIVTNNTSATKKLVVINQR